MATRTVETVRDRDHAFAAGGGIPQRQAHGVTGANPGTR